MLYFAALVSFVVTVATLVAMRRERHVRLQHGAVALAACLVATIGAYATPLFTAFTLESVLVIALTVALVGTYVWLLVRSLRAERESSAPRARNSFSTVCMACRKSLSGPAHRAE